MIQNFKVLIVEDHPVYVEIYINAINKICSEKKEFICSIDVAENCEMALDLIESAQYCDFYNLIFLDISLPHSGTSKLLSGEDIGIKIRAISSSVKIIIGTSYEDSYRLISLLRSVNPDGFLVKSDVDFGKVIHATRVVVNNSPYFSGRITQLLSSWVANAHILDKIDRQMLHLISIGTKTKDLPNYLPLSIATVERRKRNLRRALNAETNDDSSLILRAKEKGFI